MLIFVTTLKICCFMSFFGKHSLFFSFFISNFARIMLKHIIYILLSLVPIQLCAQSRIVECEDTCNHIHGIDISHYQGKVFWDIIEDNTHLAYVYIKATEGGDRIDARYEDNLRTAHNHGLKVGSYHFYRPKTPQMTQMRNFATQCLPSEQDLVPMIDIETTAGLADSAFCDSLFIFLDLVEHHYKQKPLIYTGANFYDRHLLGKLNDYKIMIAQYTDYEPRLKDDRDITMWQYTGKGHINGIKGYVDKSRFMGKHSMREIKYRHR